MDTEFDITAAESPRVGLRTFNPSGGLKTLEFQLQAEYELNEHWSLLALAEVEHYLGDAADSPLVRDIGSETTIAGLVGVLFRW